jgi:Rrf2 family protein
MQITRATNYAVRALTHLAMLPPATRLTAEELASEHHASSARAAKILQRLVSARLLVSRRGFDGGFELARAPRDISILDIVTALEGPLCLNACLDGGSGCAESAFCNERDVWARAQAALTQQLAGATLEQLAAPIREHSTVNFVAEYAGFQVPA